MNGSQYIKIALFFISLGTAGGAYILLSSDGMNSFNTKTYEAVLPDATGLSTRSRIYLAGIPVGKIRAIELTGNEARLQIALRKDVEIRADASIARRSSSILGTSMLSLDPGTELTSLLTPGGRLSAEKNARDINNIMGLVGTAGEQLTSLLREFQTNQMQLLAISLETINEITQKINSQTDAELERLSRILEAAALIAEQAEGLLLENGEGISASVAEIRGALGDIHSITGEIRGGQGNIGKTIYDGRLYDRILSTVEKADEAAEKLQTALSNINKLAVNVDGVVTSAGEVVERAAGLGIQVDSYAQYRVLSSQVQAGAALRLNPRSNDRWYRLGVSGIPGGISSRTIKEITDERGSRISYEDINETRFAFALDAEIARRFGPLTFRGGLFENTAGLGIDIQPVKWLDLSGEVFDFKSGEFPNLRGTLTLYPFFDPHSDKPWNWLYLRGGINYALDKRRDFFIGGGVRFADREVKGLVGLLPVLGGN
ncbi:MAG: MlaD family protein [Treponema sp.]|jgi:phospholipid/cholesterol/gamma-HCH transport system substrate-binding protein|nr:MlaD family protein [Treponema sp.]